jgi:hypothetical protein
VGRANSSTCGRNDGLVSFASSDRLGEQKRSIGRAEAEGARYLREGLVERLLSIRPDQIMHW